MLNIDKKLLEMIEKYKNVCSTKEYQEFEDFISHLEVVTNNPWKDQYFEDNIEKDKKLKSKKIDIPQLSEVLKSVGALKMYEKKILKYLKSIEAVLKEGVRVGKFDKSIFVDFVNAVKYCDPIKIEQLHKKVINEFCL